MESLLGRVVDEADARQLPVLIAEWLPADDVRRWIARALRIDLPVLVERPELAVPCLLRHCLQFGREGGHFKQRPTPPVDAGAVRALAARWRDEYNRPYLSSLRPPAVPLDGAVIEEYRASLQGELFADAETIGIAGAESTIAWERASGRRISSTRAAATARWDFDRGKRMPRGPHGEVDLALAHDEDAWDVIGLDDDRALVASRIDDPYGEGDDTRYLRLVDHGTVAWRVDGFAANACLFGTSVLCREFSSVLVARDLTTGADVQRYPLAIYPREVIAIDSHTFVTRDESVIRVWDATRTPWPALELASSAAGAVWSPDGKRVHTGQAISDAHTGAHLCTLDLHGLGNWLEGGPPADCRRLCNDVFIEQTPFGLYAWDSTTGRVVVEDHRRSAGIPDAVAFDPTGRYHAMWAGRNNRNGPSPLRLYTLRGGEVLFDRRVALARREHASYQLGFSPDGDTMWWIAADGKRWTFAIRAAAVRRLADDEPLPIEPPPRNADIRDGILQYRELAIPWDDETAVLSPDLRSVCGGSSHAALVP